MIVFLIINLGPQTKLSLRLITGFFEDDFSALILYKTVFWER